MKLWKLIPFILSVALLLGFQYKKEKTSCPNLGTGFVALYKMSIIPPNRTQESIFFEDTLFYNAPFMFERIYDNYSEDSTFIDPKGGMHTFHLKSYIRFIACYISNMNNKNGIAFDTSYNHPAAIRAFAGKSKGDGFGFEMSTEKDAETFQKSLQKIKDTLIEGRHCSIYVSNKTDSIQTSQGMDTIKQRKFIIDKDQKAYCYPAIAHGICRYLNGAVLYQESSTAKGAKLIMRFQYREMQPQEKIMMDKYIVLYRKNQQLLDTIKIR